VGRPAICKGPTVPVHLTDRSNLAYPRRRDATCAAELMKCAGSSDLLRTRRQRHEPIEVDAISRSLRDQKPLHAGNIELTGGFTSKTLLNY